MTHPPGIPGMVLATGGAGPPVGCRLSVTRSGPNLWWLLLGDPAVETALLADGAAPGLRPSEAVRLVDTIGESRRSPSMLAKVELDVCGAWLTVTNTGPTRPVLIRRAGWVEIRGHPRLPADGIASLRDDRIGLGPADMLLLPSDSPIADEEAPLDALFDTALQSAGTDPAELVTLVSRRSRSSYCAAVGVPANLGDDPLQRVATAMGVCRDAVQSPGYPLGDLQPDLWKEPPAAPRAARLRLTPDRSSVRTVRSLLDRLLSSWRLDGRVDDNDLKLVATELSSNAMVHGDAPETITIRYLGDRVRIEVRDASSAAPELRPQILEAEGGRGMRLVEALSRSWGVDPTASGKQVWCEVAVAASA